MDSALVVKSISYLAQHKLHLAVVVVVLLLADRFIKYWRLRQFKGPFSAGFSRKAPTPISEMPESREQRAQQPQPKKE